MPLRPETRRRRKTALPPAWARVQGQRRAARLPSPTPASPPRPPQTEAGGWLVQRCLMAICINQAHAQVESARGAGRRPRRAGEPHVCPRSPSRGALNRFFTILCMLQYVQAPCPRGRGGTPRRGPVHTLSLWPALGGQSRGDRERQGRGRGHPNMRSQGGAGQPQNMRARGEGRGGDRGGYIQRRVEQINKASQEGESRVQAGRARRRGRRGSWVTAGDAGVWGVGPLAPGVDRAEPGGEGCRSRTGVALWPLQGGAGGCPQGSPAPDLALLSLLRLRGGSSGGEERGRRIRWPVPAEGALPAPGSASVPSSCVGSAAGIS